MILGQRSLLLNQENDRKDVTQHQASQDFRKHRAACEAGAQPLYSKASCIGRGIKDNMTY